MSGDPRFWNMIARRYARRPLSDEAAHAEKLRLTRARLAPEDRIVELGCGTGTTALALAPHVARIEAWDISPAMIGIAREKGAGVENVAFHVGDTEAALATPGADAILAHSLLHLLPDWRDTIARVHAALRPGGRFVSTTFCLGGRVRALRPVVRALAPLGLFPPLQWFTAAELTGAMKAAGFELEHRWQPTPGAAEFVIARRPG
jgi:SAM-dependent methyltransferase